MCSNDVKTSLAHHNEPLPLWKYVHRDRTGRSHSPSYLQKNHGDIYESAGDIAKHPRDVRGYKVVR